MNAGDIADKLDEAVGSIRRAIAIVEAVGQESLRPDSLIGVHPRLTEVLQDLREAASDAAKTERQVAA